MRLPIERTCKACGVIYESSAPHSYYCSQACRQKHKTDYCRDYRDKNREKIKKYNRDYWRKTHE